jgi:hypothetical protein
MKATGDDMTKDEVRSVKCKCKRNLHSPFPKERKGRRRMLGEALEGEEDGQVKTEGEWG